MATARIIMPLSCPVGSDVYRKLCASCRSSLSNLCHWRRCSATLIQPVSAVLMHGSLFTGQHTAGDRMLRLQPCSMQQPL